MTKIIVTPIDMSAPGSYRERKQMIKAYAALQEAWKASDLAQLDTAFDGIERLVLAHATTDDGTSVSDALGEASAEDFDRLMWAIVNGETVPNPSSVS